MLRKLRDDEQGFTLIELLVVILIVGILAAIALPTFLGQQKKGQDASAKSDARNLVSQVESCYADTQDYAGCQLPLDARQHRPRHRHRQRPGRRDRRRSATGYTVTATSKSRQHVHHHEAPAAGDARTCTHRRHGRMPDRRQPGSPATAPQSIPPRRAPGPASSHLSQGESHLACGPCFPSALRKRRAGLYAHRAPRRHPDHRHPCRDRSADVPRPAEEGPGRGGEVRRS